MEIVAAVASWLKVSPFVECVRRVVLLAVTASKSFGVMLSRRPRTCSLYLRTQYVVSLIARSPSKHLHLVVDVCADGTSSVSSAGVVPAISKCGIPSIFLLALPSASLQFPSFLLLLFVSLPIANDQGAESTAIFSFLLQFLLSDGVTAHVVAGWTNGDSSASAARWCLCEVLVIVVDFLGVVVMAEVVVLDGDGARSGMVEQKVSAGNETKEPI